MFFLIRVKKRDGRVRRKLRGAELAIGGFGTSLDGVCRRERAGTQLLAGAMLRLGGVAAVAAQTQRMTAQKAAVATAHERAKEDGLF